MKFPKIDSTSAVEAFSVTAGALRVTDPCYDMETWCAGTLENVRNGLWHAHVGYHKDSLDMEMNAKWRANRVEELEKAKGGVMESYYAEKLKEYDEASAAYIGRVAYIHIVQADTLTDQFNHELPLSDSFELTGIDVGVDSGQAGFFDLEKYALAVSDKGERRADRGQTFEEFYDSVCDLTLDRKSFGVVPFGCVSSSGYGDGGYECYVRRNEVGEAVEALIVFIGEYEEEEEGAE